MLTISSFIYKIEYIAFYDNEKCNIGYEEDAYVGF